MKRSEFLQFLGSGTAGLFIPLPLVEAQQERLILYDNYLRGTQYYEMDKVMKAIWPGQKLDLHRERENLHDSFAIRVLYKSYMLGYVAAYENIVLANLMDAGLALHAHISSIAPHKTYREVGIRIALDLPLHLLKTIRDWKPMGRADDAVDVYRAGKTVII